MKLNNKQAFTLIELLVVVLIIGILASVALPQYQKAVEKSRAAEARNILNSISTAYKAYVLENDKIPSSFADLSISFTDENGNPVTGPSFNSKYFTYAIAGSHPNFDCPTSGNLYPNTVSALRRDDNNKYVLHRCPTAPDTFFCNEDESAWGLVAGSCKKAGFSNNIGNCLSDYACWTD